MSYRTSTYNQKSNTYTNPPTATWSLPVNSLPEDYKPVTSQQILQNYQDDILLLRNVLSPSECKHFIQETESLGYQEMPEYPSEYRSNTRVIVNDTDLAELIFNRIQAHTPQKLKGGWEMVDLNECFRFCKYTPGQHFSAHNDGAFIKSPSHKSRLTFMIYLNEGFQGGTTRFLKGNDVVYQVVPETGMALVFPHQTFHDGEAVKSDVKYIMRSDVMYRKQ